MKTLSIMMAGMLLAAGVSGAVYAAQDQEMTHDKMMMKAGTAMEAMSGHGTYADYSPSAFDAAKDQKRVYFFAANWCPVCMATDKALKTSAAKIPAGVTVFKTDFDTAAELKAKYEITHMDTFVEVDKDGQKIALWNGGGVEGLSKNLK